MTTGMTMSAATAVTWLLSLREAAQVDRHDDRLHVSHAFGAVRLPADAVLSACVDALGDRPVSVATLEAAALRECTRHGVDPVLALARLYQLLETLGPGLTHTLAVDGDELARVVPLATGATFDPPVAVRLSAAPVVLSRLSLIRRGPHGTVLESGHTPYRVELRDHRAAALAARLTTPATADELAGATGLAAPAVAALVGTFVAAGLTDADDASFDQWGFHELLFHARSRMGRHDDRMGATYRFLGDREPEPGIKPPVAGPAVELFRPDFAEVLAHDPPLLVAQEGRRSLRHPGAVALSQRQLGEFLYRVGRIRTTYGPDPERKLPYEAVDRPYPSGGATGDLEIYVTAHRVEGLEPGSYHYDAVGHRLVRVCDDPALFGGLLAMAARSAGDVPQPDALLTFTSRFGRLNWKYEAMPYAATLKHVGVAYQTCYLVATAMRLSPCGLGVGDAHLSARVFGLDWHRESSVGEFMLSSLPETDNGLRATEHQAGWRAWNDPQWTSEAAYVLRT